MKQGTKKLFALLLVLLYVLSLTACGIIPTGSSEAEQSTTRKPKATKSTTANPEPDESSDPTDGDVPTTAAPTDGDVPTTAAPTDGDVPTTAAPTEDDEPIDGTSDAQELSFKSVNKFEDLKKLDGQKVYICGYMCQSSPVDGSFMYLMNLPDQSCPFCLPNTSQLSNTMAVYPKKGRSFKFTDSSVPILVLGTLEVAESENAPFSDEYGYEFCFRIVKASYRKMKESEVTEQMKLMKKIASSGIMTDINNMFNYLHFVCDWPEYFVNSYTDEKGKLHAGYYLYASDALRFLESDGAQYHYGYVDGYFDSLVKAAEDLNMDGTDFLVEIIRNAEALANKAVSDLNDGEYTYEVQYVEKFGTNDYIYTLNRGEELLAEYEKLYNDFEQSWLP